jgi:hypothetical protein
VSCKTDPDERIGAVAVSASGGAPANPGAPRAAGKLHAACNSSRVAAAISSFFIFTGNPFEECRGCPESTFGQRLKAEKAAKNSETKKLAA